MRWLLVALLAAGVLWWLWHAPRPALDNGPILPAQTGTGDRTAQRPKARPWRG